MSTQTLPAPNSTRGANADLMHLVCGWSCNDDLALCGLDVTNEPWGEDEANVCLVCDEIDRGPCSSATCPARTA